MKSSRANFLSKSTRYVLCSLFIIVSCILLITLYVTQADAAGTVTTTNTIPEGVYQLRNAYTEKYMQVQGTYNGAKVIQNTNNNSSNQKFIVRSSGIDNNQYYILLADCVNMSLDINSGSSNNIQLEVFRHLYYTPLSYSNQRFLIEKVGNNNYYSIKTNCGTNNCITVNTSTNAVMQDTFSSNLKNYWYFERCSDTTGNVEDGFYYIKNTYSGKYMEVQNAATANGSKIIQAAKSSSFHQMFRVDSLGNNQYSIRPIHIESKSLDIPNWSQGVVQAEIYTFGGTDDPSNQTFVINRVDTSGNYSIKPLHTVGNPNYGFSNSCLTVNTSTNAVMQDVYASSSNLNHWKFEEAPILKDGVYSLQSTIYPSLFIDVPSCDPNHRQILRQWDYEGNPATMQIPDRAGLFKFVRQSHNVYKIYPMANNENVLAAYPNRSQIITYSHGEFLWNVTMNDIGNIYISSDSTSNQEVYIRANSNSSSDQPLRLGTSSDTGIGWIATPCSANLFGVTVSLPGMHIIEMGTTGFDLSALGDHLSFFSSNPTQNQAGTITGYSVTDCTIDGVQGISGGGATTIASVTSTGILNCYSDKVGIVKVTAHYSSGAEASTNIYVKPPDTGREFFILQHTQNGFWCIDRTGSSATKAAFDYDETQIWEWVHHEGEWYKIKNVATGQFLSSPSNTVSGAAVTLTSSTTVTDNVLWRKTTSPTNARKVLFQSKYMYENAPSMYLLLDNSSLQQRAYVTSIPQPFEFNYIKLGDEAVYNRNITWPTNIDPSTFMAELAGHYDSFMLIHPDIYLDLATAKDLLESSKIIIFDGHGGPGGMAIRERPQELIGNVDIYDPDNPENSLDLSGVDIVFFNGCSTAGITCSECAKQKETRSIVNGVCEHTDDPVPNMPQSAEAAGAKVAIGWTEDLADNHANDWIDVFLEYMNQNYTAAEACDMANNDVQLGNANTAECHGTNKDFRFQ